MSHQSLIETIFESSSVEFETLSGGDINAVYRVKPAADANYSVIKINNCNTFPQMLQKEAEGLYELRKNKTLHVPKVQSFGELNEFQYLVLEYIEEAPINETFWSRFGEGLASQHKITAAQFGLAINNYIGSLHQSNQFHATWLDFLVTERLIPQIKLAVDNHLINSSELKQIERFYAEINNIWPQEKPALLHGDLWAGNFIKGSENQPVLIDPAVYYGHREMDLGMLHLFGGFDSILLDYYHAYYPLEVGWEKRMKFNQIYPLLVHLNLFGRTYLDQINAIIKPF